jgi:glycosyltransferase involved in cell wall biosynthesis
MKLSVLVRTFNHERFIREAIESVLMQRTGFDYEIVVGDDCSTDATRELLKEFESLHPDKLRLLLYKARIGPFKSYGTVLEACRGEYVAVLDGDDYWISPEKLQKQVDFLDSHPGCPMCCHNARFVCDASEFESVPVQTTPIKPFLGVEELLDRCPALPTTTVVRRNAELAVRDVPLVFLRDKARAVALAHRYGPIGYIDQVMSAWRLHEGGVLNSRWTLPLSDRRIRSHNVAIEFYEAMDDFLKHRFHDRIASLVVRHYYALAWCYAKRRDWSEMLDQLGKGWAVTRLPGEAVTLRSTRRSNSLLWRALWSAIRSTGPPAARKQWRLAKSSSASVCRNETTEN